jgi:NAD(P)-dependent dehydrogenase (short-subunit alcohol dehydrogenase family)
MQGVTAEDPTAGRFAGTVAMVTGGASGIGRATVERLAREGATVGILDLQGDVAAALARTLSAEHARVQAFAVDVSNVDAVETVFAEVEAELGPPDALFNAAGVYGEDPIPDGRSDAFDRLFAVNVRGTWLTSGAFIRSALARGAPGTIVNIASVVALFADPAAPAYCATKGAIISLTRALAFDHGVHGIRANCVCPGHIRTPMTEAFYTEEVTRRLIRDHPAGRIGVPEDVAAASLFLASEDAGFITGQVLIVDGGFSAGRALPEAGS